MESIYEYGARAGFWRLHRLLSDLPVTVFGVATALARSPGQVAAMQSAGWEIASHGLKWIEHKDMGIEEERAQIAAAIALHREVTGAPPPGWYTGRCSVNTQDLVAEALPSAWIADAYDDDLPYWKRFAGGERLIVPYTLDCNDMRFATPQGFNSGDQFFAYLRDTFDVLYAEGEAGQAKMMSVGLHCRLVGRPGRIAALARFLEHAQSREGVWFATRGQIADHWARTHPVAPRERPHEMDRAAFVARFGGVYEHSPWIAEGAHALELGPAHDTAAGLANALARVFRSADPAARLGVLNAHPDLAGRLAAAKRLTEDSASEQASAGLDALSDAERAAFTDLNAAYREKFGFPFIVAVRDHTRASILESFRARLGNAPGEEFETACRQVERIAALRLAQMLPE